MTDSWQQSRLTHRARQRDAIAAAALELLAEHGTSALTMSAIARAAGVSRQTLYRYHPDIDAVLIDVARFITSHDEELERWVAEQPDASSQLEAIIDAVTAGHHPDLDPDTVRAALPPVARVVLADHDARVHRLVAEVLRRGVDEGTFRPDLEPATDSRLLLGLLAAAPPDHAERAATLAHRLVDPPTAPPPNTLEVPNP